MFNFQWPWMVFLLILPTLMWLKRSFGRWDGLIMISMYVVYLALALFIFIAP